MRKFLGNKYREKRMGAYGKMLNGRIVGLVLKSPSYTSTRGG
jgi:hypothetical protein